MQCPNCESHNTSVKDSRNTGEFGGNVRRRRHCNECSHRFTTYELTEKQLDSLRPFPDVQKAILSMRQAIDVLENVSDCSAVFPEVRT